IGFLIILFSCISYSQNIIIDKNDKLNRNSNLNLLIYSAEADIETSLYKCVADALTGEYEFSDENDIEEIGNYAKNEFGNFLSYNFPKEDKNYVIGIESYELNTSLKYSYEKNGRSFIQTVKNYFFNFTGKVKLWIKDIIKDIIYYKDLIINKIIDTGEGIIKSLIDKFSKKAIEKYIVGAYYYPWYNGTAKIHWPEGYKNNPILGEYDSGNSTIAEKHISWAYRYGINVFSVSWWGPNCSEEQNLQNGLLSARNINDIKFSIYYESIGRLGDCDFDDLNTKKTFTSDLYYIAKKYFSHPSYYKIDNRPVLGIYSANLFKGDYKNAILEARANLSENGYELYLIGDFHTTIPPFILTNKIRCFDAVSPYNPYNSIIAKLSFQKMSFFTKIIETQYIIWKLWVTSLKVHGYKDRKLDFMPCAIPSYDDTALKNRNNKPIHGDKDDFVQTLKMAKKSSDKVGKEGNRVIWLCSFNEWHEGTTIEPSIEYDFDYLEALNIVFEPNTYKIGNLTGNIQWTEINKNKGNK
ncbi:MAG: glycoside hydrolase family 99-like domain-containing protein, partial [Candidatus Thermoplasmatota archaeon]